MVKFSAIRIETLAITSSKMSVPEEVLRYVYSSIPLSHVLSATVPDQDFVVQVLQQQINASPHRNLSAHSLRKIVDSIHRTIDLCEKALWDSEPKLTKATQTETLSYR